MIFIWPALLAAAIVGAEAPSDGQLTLTVVDQRGVTVSGVEVSVTGPVIRQATTDGNGATVFSNLPAGPYRLSTRSFGSVSESREVIVRAGAVTELTIEFRLDWLRDPRSGKAIRDTFSVRCDLTSQGSIDASWRLADAVARIWIETQSVYDHWKFRQDGFPIVTLHQARVVELFKAHAHVPADATTVNVLQEGGVIEHADLIEKASAPGSALLEASRDYVVFLRWSDQWREWTVAGCDLRAIEIAGDKDERLSILRGIKD